MKNNNKMLRVLSTGAMAGVMLAALGATANAKTTDILVKDNGNLQQYKYQDLVDSLLGDKVLFNEFKTKQVMSYKDDKAGYVDFNYIVDKYMNMDKKDFVLNTITETAPASKILTPEGVITPRVMNPDGTIGNGTVISAVDKSVLDTAIAVYNTQANAAVAGMEVGNYAQADIDAFKGAIAAAQAVKNNAGATQADVDSAIATLRAAKTSFEAKAIKVSFGISAINAINGQNKVSINGATGVLTSSAFEINFNKNFDSSTVDNNAVKVINKTTGAEMAGTFTYDILNNKAIFTPNALLQDATNYKIVIANSIKSADGTLIAPALSYDFSTGSAVVVSALNAAGSAITLDGTAITTGGANGILNNTETILATFNKDVDAATVTTSTFKLFNVTQNKYVPNSSATIGYNASTRVATFTVSADQNKGDRFRVIISGVKDLSGNAVADYSREFVTGTAATAAAQALNVASPNVYPSIKSATINGTYVQGFRLIYTFDTNMDASTLNAQTVQIRKQGSTVGLPATVSFDSASNTLTVVPTADLESNANYNIYFDIDSIKTATGLKLTDPSSSFTTGDYVVPTMVSSTPVNYATGVVEDDKIKVTFSEALDQASVVGGNVNTFDSTNSVVLVDSSNNAINITGKISFEDSGKTVVLDTSTLGLTKATTYTLKFNGGNNSNKLVRDTASAIAAQGNALAQELDLTFTTRNEDTTAPVVSKVLMGTSYSKATAVQAGSLNNDFDSDLNNLYIVFNKQMNNTISADNTANTNDDGNVIVERRKAGDTAWTQVAYGSGSATVTDDLQAKVSYVTVPNTVLDANAADSYEYRVRIVPTVGGTTVKDTAGTPNKLANTYSFGLIRKGTGFEVKTVASGTNMATSRNTLGAAMAAGTTAVTTNLTASVNDVVAIQQHDGSYFFSKVATVDGSNKITAIADSLPSSGSGAANGAAIINLAANMASYANLETSIAKDAPLAIAIASTNTADIDLSTINANNVKLVKADGTVVAASLTYKVINNIAYVSIAHTQDLAENTQYNVVVSGVKDQLGNTVKAKTTSFITAEDTPDALTITSITPADNAGNITVDAPIVINFSTEPTTALSYVTGTPAGAGQIAVYDVTAGAYLGANDVTLKTSNGGKTATLTPNSFLAPNHVYKVVVDNLTANAGGALDAATDKTYSFITEKTASKTPQIASAKLLDSDNNGLGDANEKILITFNTAVNVNGGTFSMTDLAIGNGANLDDSTVVLSADGKSALITLKNGNSLLSVVGGVSTINIVADGTPIKANGVLFSTDSITITK